MAITWKNVTQDNSAAVAALNRAYGNLNDSISRVAQGVDTIGNRYIDQGIAGIEDSYIANLQQGGDYRGLRDGQAAEQANIAGASSLLNRDRLNQAYQARQQQLLGEERKELGQQYQTSLNNREYGAALDIARNNSDILENAALMEGDAIQQERTYQGEELTKAFDQLMFANRNQEAIDLARNNQDLMPDAIGKMRIADQARKDYDFNNTITNMSDPDYAHKLSMSMLSSDDIREIENHRLEDGTLDLEAIDRGTFDRMEAATNLARDKGAMMTMIKKKLSQDKDLTPERRVFLEQLAEQRIKEATSLNTFNQENLAKWTKTELTSPDLVNNVYINHENAGRNTTEINTAIGEVTKYMAENRDALGLSVTEMRKAASAIMKLANGTYLGKDGKYEGLAIPMDASMVEAMIAAVPQIDQLGGSVDTVAEAFITAMGLDKQADRYLQFRERREAHTNALLLTQGTELPYRKETKQLQDYKNEATKFLVTLMQERADYDKEQAKNPTPQRGKQYKQPTEKQTLEAAKREVNEATKDMTTVEELQAYSNSLRANGPENTFWGNRANHRDDRVLSREVQETQQKVDQLIEAAKTNHEKFEAGGYNAATRNYNARNINRRLANEIQLLERHKAELETVSGNIADVRALNDKIAEVRRVMSERQSKDRIEVINDYIHKNQ